ncbi:hypothetical protein [Pseudothauera rhizosphaerae]|uniref:Uncharacterized protein n=1 Tax=Pseudothauera rhizosphaerae TaxID=2565932 RepID=A0A4S4AVU2_9RHOO|nr:hypothetical protein [Pseudothauera rhizosphaerae]THF64139.1 hypothetical protein E6O51_02100 [Pseudothauera rhizosphaerae]
MNTSSHHDFLLSKEEFFRKATEIGGGHWNSQPLDLRWNYHCSAIEIVRKIGISKPQEVLEIGTVGLQIVKGSDTLDQDKYWNYPGKNPTFMHDARNTPWPVQNAYKIIIALRVFQYLAPYQEQAFNEARRLCRHLILVVPRGDAYRPKGLETSKGIALTEFLRWSDGMPPRLFQETSMGDLYHWDFTQDAERTP